MCRMTLARVTGSSSKPPCVVLAVSAPGAEYARTRLGPIPLSYAAFTLASKYLSIPRIGMPRPPSNDSDTRYRSERE